MLLFFHDEKYITHEIIEEICIYLYEITQNIEKYSKGGYYHGEKEEKEITTSVEQERNINIISIF